MGFSKVTQWPAADTGWGGRVRPLHGRLLGREICVLAVTTSSDRMGRLLFFVFFHTFCCLPAAHKGCCVVLYRALAQLPYM